ncbi:MAG: Tol-Pal system protein TolB [Micavibrio aeruginosavorus]|uniref:Tol-Pal system protein TolB n=1 Tax=Micavibrio aeruginosavorus TaxID=349221 RepID=A0A7T5UFQ6_9BACT|nr:MAG: Tol-Pal system protein TolB [Micavibrio aeruginosavorus]
MKHLWLALFGLAMLVNISSAKAELTVAIGSANMEPLPIAISPFYADAGADQIVATDMPRVIEANLERTGLFKPLNPRSFIQTPESLVKDGPRFAEWRAVNGQALVTGHVTRSADGRTRVEFRLWDVFGQAQMIGMAYTTTPQNWRRIAHIISDEIYKRITGENGYFDTRIVYISETGPSNARVKRLAIMDQDGYNHKYLTDGKYLVLTPRFSPNSQMITYMAYYNDTPRVYIYNIDTGRQEVLGDFQGMTFAPRFSPDGSKVIMSMAKDGNSDIFTMDLRSRKVTKLTNHPSIDTSPSYAPDGRQIAFESDRGGTQQIYVMGADGSNPQRITFGQGRYGNPVWSPRGDLIAFTRMYQGKFYIGVIRPDGSGERLITSAYHVEGPTWSPNGRVLAYFKESPSGGTRTAKVYTIDLTGYNERLMQTPADGSDPAWSPVNP